MATMRTSTMYKVIREKKLKQQKQGVMIRTEHAWVTEDNWKLNEWTTLIISKLLLQVTTNWHPLVSSLYQTNWFHGFKIMFLPNPKPGISIYHPRSLIIPCLRPPPASSSWVAACLRRWIQKTQPSPLDARWFHPSPTPISHLPIPLILIMRVRNLHLFPLGEARIFIIIILITILIVMEEVKTRN